MLLANRASEHDGVGVVVDGLVDNRRPGRSGLQEFGANILALAADASRSECLGIAQDLLTTLDFSRQFGIEWHRLLYFDDIGNGDMGVLALADFLDNLEESLIVTAPVT